MLTVEFKIVYVATGQSLQDIAIQEYGCYDAVFELYYDNEDVLEFLNEMPAPGTPLKIRSNVPNITSDNQSFAKYFSEKGRVVTCGLKNDTYPLPAWWPLLSGGAGMPLRSFIEDDYWDSDYSM